MLPPLPPEIHRLILHSLDPTDVLSRRTLALCHRLSTSFLLHASAALWSSAELHVDGTIRRRYSNGFEKIRTGRVDRVVLALRITDGDDDDPGGKDKGGTGDGMGGSEPWRRGGAAWRWWCYLRSVRKLVVSVPRHRDVDDRVPASTLGSWLGPLHEVEVRVPENGEGDGWIAWLEDRWARGHVAPTLKLVDAPLRLAKTLAGHRRVRRLSVGALVGGGGEFGPLLRSIRHGLEHLQIGKETISGMLFNVAWCGPDGMADLQEYAARHVGVLKGLHLTTYFAYNEFPDRLPIVALHLLFPKNPQSLTSAAYLKSLRRFSVITSTMQENVLTDLLMGLQCVEVLEIAPISISRRLCMKILPRLTRLQEVSISVFNLRDLRDLIRGLQQLPQLQNFNLQTFTRISSLDVGTLITGLPLLETLAVDSHSTVIKCKVGALGNLKHLQLKNVILIVEDALLECECLPYLEHLSVEAPYPQVVDSNGDDVKIGLWSLLANRSFAPRLESTGYWSYG
ncbi:hypothetical protein HK101_003164 [Irineochytrium annulatum]|nr:hypothetical protein HK101_003164 [Irineochytrium annulatum]